MLNKKEKRNAEATAERLIGRHKKQGGKLATKGGAGGTRRR